MCHFNSATMKRTILWSTGSALAALKPFATMRRKDFKFDTGKSTTDKYINKSGRVAYKGSKHLKSSQCLDDRLVVWMFWIFEFFPQAKPKIIFNLESEPSRTKGLYSQICWLCDPNDGALQWPEAQATTANSTLYAM